MHQLHVHSGGYFSMLDEQVGHLGMLNICFYVCIYLLSEHLIGFVY